MNVYDKTIDLIEMAYNKGDCDAVYLVEHGFKEAFAAFMDGCYSEKDFCVFVVEHDFDVCCDFRYSNIEAWGDVIQYADDMREDPEGFYNVDFEDWDELDDDEKKERLYNAFDGLFTSSEYVCISW